MRRIAQSFFTGEALDLYLAFSFFTSALLWIIGCLHYSFENSFFESVLAIISLYAWVQGIGYRSIMSEDKRLPHLLMFQAIMLIAIAFSLDKIGIIYLAMIPSIFSFYVNRNGQVPVISSKKSIVLVLTTCSTYLFFHNYSTHNFLFNIEGIVLVSFIFWTMALFHNPFKKRRSDQRSKKLFFHDMVNHTHAINLFLSNRVSLKRSIEVDECQALIGEIKTMQSLLKDYFGFGHRDLINPYEFVSFEYAKDGIVNLVRSFLPSHLVACTFTYKGLLQGSILEKDNCIIHYPTVSRILTNLIKNISESGSSEVYFEFDYQDNGFYMVIKNRIFNLDNDSMSLSKDLKKIILAAPKSERDRKIRGIGLESVASICNEANGSFSFGVIDGFWINELFLPKQQIKNKAA